MNVLVILGNIATSSSTLELKMRVVVHDEAYC